MTLPPDKAESHMPKVVLASGNPGKLREFQQLLSGCGYDLLPQTDFALESAAETGLTFVENAIIKARHACAATELAALADDSGIEVDALNGQPGIYSARFAGEDASDQDNNRLLLERLQGVPTDKRTARYQCLLVYMRHAQDPTPLICQGSWEGRILEAPRGAGGFGYDPLFFVPSHQCSAAELTLEVKGTISHRARASAQLLRALQTQRS